MRLLDRIRQMFRALARGRAADRELDAELGTWLAELAARHRRAGRSPDEAWHLARAELGQVDRLKDEVQSARPVARIRPLIRGTASDLRYACRSLGRTPGFAVAV